MPGPASLISSQPGFRLARLGASATLETDKGLWEWAMGLPAALGAEFVKLTESEKPREREVHIGPAFFGTEHPSGGLLILSEIEGTNLAVLIAGRYYFQSTDDEVSTHPPGIVAEQFVQVANRLLERATSGAWIMEVELQASAFPSRVCRPVASTDHDASVLAVGGNVRRSRVDYQFEVPGAGSSQIRVTQGKAGDPFGVHMHIRGPLPKTWEELHPEGVDVANRVLPMLFEPLAPGTGS